MTQTDNAQKWIDENQEAIDSSNAYVDQHGLPLGPQWVAASAAAFSCWNEYVERHGLPLAKYWSAGSISEHKEKPLTEDDPNNIRKI